ncbi:MAG: hypothetical protein LBL16_05330 [Endomicrobium sp.]|jgi:hypothetical protein|nr:hypothetical protein [Endomicrobium sp.]
MWGKKHLSKAMEFLRCHNGRDSDFRNSIKESISAMEYVVRDITGASTLGEGLKKLKEGEKINSYFIKAFHKLYAYTNSEGGIRHANMNDNNNVYFEEAKFMSVACSAFINYIKQSQLKNYGIFQSGTVL